MASSYFLCSPFKIFDPLSETQTIKQNSNGKARTAVRAAKHEAGDHDFFSGRLVDEGLFVLRKRIHEVKKSERSHDREARREWMDWEKQFYDTSYDLMICEAIGELQSYLMETRPSLALGVAALIALSVPISTALVICNLLEWIKVLIPGIHLISLLL